MKTQSRSDDKPLAKFLVTKQPWVSEAACKNMDTDLFFNSGLEDAAIRVCEGCAHREPCLALAMTEEGNAPYGRYGVRGGLTPGARATLHKTGRRVQSRTRN